MKVMAAENWRAGLRGGLGKARFRAVRWMRARRMEKRVIVGEDCVGCVVDWGYLLVCVMREEGCVLVDFFFFFFGKCLRHEGACCWL